MAEHHAAAAAAEGHPDMDYAEHEKTYRLFLTFGEIWDRDRHRPRYSPCRPDALTFGSTMS